jgi:cytosine deaminase
MAVDKFMQAAIEEALLGMEEGGTPIGSVLMLDGVIVARGRNRQNQLNSVIRHAEMDCIDNAGNLTAQEYRRAVLYTTLSPCDMCSGAILFFKIPKVVIAENTNILGAEQYLRSRGVEVVLLNDPDCIRMLRQFDLAHPGVWQKGE